MSNSAKNKSGELSVASPSPNVEAASRLHSSALENTLELFSNSNFSDKNIVSKLQIALIDKDYNALQSEFETCQNVALILPEYMCNQLARRSEPNNENVIDVGREIYGNISIGISFVGAFPTVMLKRVKNLKTSGLLEWWISFTAVDRHTATNLPPLKPNMQGNTVIIFYILAIGLTIASTVLVTEARACIWIFAIRSATSILYCCQTTFRVLVANITTLLSIVPGNLTLVFLYV